MNVLVCIKQVPDNSVVPKLDPKPTVSPLRAWS